MTDRDAFDDFAEGLARSWRSLRWASFDPRNYTVEGRALGHFLIVWAIYYGIARFVMWLLGWEWH